MIYEKLAFIILKTAKKKIKGLLHTKLYNQSL